MSPGDEKFYGTRNRFVSFEALDYPSAWPKADSGKCCIFEALNIVGTAKFGSEWTGTELGALNWVVQPKDAEAKRLAMLRATRFKPKALPPPISAIAPLGQVLRSRKIPVANNYDYHLVTRRAHISETSRLLAIETDQLAWETNRETLIRLSWATEWIAQKCRDDLLHSFARLRTGGELWPMAASEWMLDYPLATFVAEGGHKRYFANLAPPGAYDVYLFFDRAELTTLIAAFPHTTVALPTVELSLLSPYLRLAVRIALKEAADDRKPWSKDSRLSEIKAAWPDADLGVDYSKTQAEHIADVVKWPDSKAIEAGRKGHAFKKG